MKRFRTSFIILGVGLLLMASACRSKPEKAMQESSRNLRLILAAYSKAAQELSRPPSSVQDILPYLQEAGETDEILRSPDDGEPYVILWGADSSANPAVVLAYEKHGKNGRRYVLWGHVVWSLRDEEFKAKPFPPGHSPPN
jgi:hypothetical protein